MSMYTDKVAEINAGSRITSDKATDRLVGKVHASIIKEYGGVAKDLIRHLVDAYSEGWRWRNSGGSYSDGMNTARMVMLGDMVVYGTTGVLDEAGIWSKGRMYAELIILKTYGL